MLFFFSNFHSSEKVDFDNKQPNLKIEQRIFRYISQKKHIQTSSRIWSIKNAQCQWSSGKCTLEAYVIAPWLFSKEWKKSVGGDMEKGEALYTVGWNVNKDKHNGKIN
jgi:hypothetical protein